MLNFSFNSDKKVRILCLGAHCDDIEIGCGGTLLSIINMCKKADVLWIVFSSDCIREKEAISSANIFLKQAYKKNITIGKFRDGFFPYTGIEIKEYFEELKKAFSPDLIFTHYKADLHQDHRTISELTWNTFRDHFILEYEIPKYDGDFGAPNFFVPLEPSICHTKIKYILTSFKTQSDRHWLTEDLLFSTLRIRGIECVSPTKYAESFYCKKILFKC